ncbi:hypothetical protein QBC34DRAFT_464158, partial [Podospora aff. communis PSN243]
MAGQITHANSTMAALEPYIEELASKPPTTLVERETWEEFRRGVVAHVNDPSSPAAREFACLRSEYCPAAADFVRAMKFMENPMANFSLGPRGPSDALSSSPFRYAAIILVANHQRLTGDGTVHPSLQSRLSDDRIAFASLTRPQESYLPTITAFLNDNNHQSEEESNGQPEQKGRGAPFATCPLCTAELSLHGIPPLTPSPFSEEEAELERAPSVVLPCGHLLCTPCWDALDQNTPKIQAHLTPCPLCRHPTRAAECKHRLVVAVPTAAAEKTDTENPMGFMTGFKLKVKTTQDGRQKIEQPKWCDECERSGVAGDLSLGNEGGWQTRGWWENDARWQDMVRWLSEEMDRMRGMHD